MSTDAASQAIESAPKVIRPGVARNGDDLTPQQDAFVTEMLRHGNQTEAAMQSYNCKDRATAASMGSELLRVPKVQRAIQKATARRMNPELVIANFVDAAGFDHAGAFNPDGSYKRNIHDIPRDVRRRIKKGKWLEKWEGEGEERVFVGEILELEFFDHVEPTRDLARIQGMVKDGSTTNHIGSVNVGSIPLPDDPESLREMLAVSARMKWRAAHPGEQPPAVVFPALTEREVVDVRASAEDVEATAVQADSVGIAHDRVVDPPPLGAK